MHSDNDSSHFLPASKELTEPRPEAKPPSLAARFFGGLASALRRPVVVLLCLLTVVVGAYRPALDAQFVWDDNMLVRNNLLIRSPLFILEAFRRTLFEGQSNFYRPSQTLLFIADYWAWGYQAFGYHLASILIHALNGFVLFLLLRRLLPSLLPKASAVHEVQAGQHLDFLSLMLALLWVLYPVHSAAVAYVSGSADSLAMLFCVLAWLGADRCLRTEKLGGRLAWGLAAGGCLLAGFCSKEIAFVWLTLYAAYVFLFSSTRGADLRRKTALMAGSLLVVGVYVLLRHIPSTPPTPPVHQEFSRGIMALRALGDYGSLLLFPGKLLMERQVYPAPGAVLTAEDRLFYNSLTAGGVMLLTLFALGCAWHGNGQRLRLFGLCWFVCGFLPVSNLFVTINASVAEHWLYLPSIGFLLFVAGCAWQMPTRRLRLAALTVAVMASAAFGVRTYWRAFDWKDEITFFRQTVLAGGDVPRARLGMANAYSHQQQDATAIVFLRQVAAECPNNLVAQVNLASALARQGQGEEARLILEKAFLRTDIQEPRALLVILSDLDLLEGDRPGWAALKQSALAKARHQHPDSWELVQDFARAKQVAGKSSLALEEVSRYAQAHWWHYPSWYLLGCLYGEEGQLAQAVTTLKYASRLDTHDAEALSKAAEACVRQGHLAEAATLQREAVARQPDSPRQRLLLSEILGSSSQPVESARQLAIATAQLQTAAPILP